MNFFLDVECKPWYDKFMEVIGMTENERVRAVRKAKKLTLEQFGAVIGMSRSTISDIENGNRSVTRL